MNYRPSPVGRLSDIDRQTTVYHPRCRSDSMDTDDRLRTLCRNDCGLEEKQIHRPTVGASVPETCWASGKQPG